MQKQNCDIGSLLLRIAFSISMIAIHGIDKLTMLINGETGFPDPLNVGVTATLLLLVIAELVCPILVLLGYKTKIAVIPTLGAMLVALLVFHSGDPFVDRELAYIYLMSNSAIFFLGSGKYSIDHWLEVKRVRH